LGFNTSPLDDQTVQAYQNQVTTGVQKLSDICTIQSIPVCMITAAGIWGTTLRSPIWSENYLEVFKTSVNLTRSSKLKGLMFFDGNAQTNGELALINYANVRQYISDYFGSNH
jgi:hypothetical protein